MFVVAFLLSSLFSFVIIAGQNVICSSKDTAATKVAVELVIKTISMSLLLTLKIVYYCSLATDYYYYITVIAAFQII